LFRGAVYKSPYVPVFDVFREQICCGLCIYRRQFGLRICCGNNDDDDHDPSAQRGRRKTHIVLAAQYNRAFDDSAPARDNKSPTVVTDQPPSSAKENGILTASQSSTTEHDGEATAPNSPSEKAYCEIDATVANAGSDSKVVDDVASGGLLFPDAADNAVDVEAVSQEEVNVADDELREVVKATTNDNNSDRIDDAISDRSDVDVNRLPDDCLPGNDNQTTSSLIGNEKSSTTLKETVEPDSKLCEPEAEMENSGRKKTTPLHRRWRSMGAGSRMRRVIDTPSSDKAVNVYEDDLVVRPEAKIVTENETDALSEVTTNDEGREEREEKVKDGNGETNTTEDATQTVSAGEESDVEDARTFDGNLVLNLNELGILAAPNVKHEEVRVITRANPCLGYREMAKVPP